MTGDPKIPNHTHQRGQMKQMVFHDGKLKSKADVAMERLRAYEPEKGYYLAFSGGKDSIVIKTLADMAGVKYDAHHNLTTLDPPEVVRFIKQEYPDVQIHPPKETFWQLMRRKGFPPTRSVRYCCSVLKERGGNGRIIITGVRWAESRKRRERNVVDFAAYTTSTAAAEQREIFSHTDDPVEKRRLLEACKFGRHVLNPIIDWSDADVWEFIRGHGLKYPSLYDDGWTRIGCISCPLTSPTKRARELKRYPEYRRAFIRVFDDMISEGHAKGIYLQYANGEEAFEFWVEHGQISKEAAP